MVILILGYSIIKGDAINTNSHPEGNFQVITSSEVKKAIEQKENMIVLYGQELCGSCESMKALIVEVNKQFNINVKYLDADSFTNSTALLEEYQIQSSPTLLILKNGVLKTYEGMLTKDMLIYLFDNYKNFDFIPERFSKVEAIEYNQLVEKKMQKTDFIVYIGREDCPDCNNFDLILEKYIEQNEHAGIYYFSIKEIRDLACMDNASDEQIKEYERVVEEFNIEWVPSIYHIRDGIIISKYEYLSKEYYLIDNNIEKIDAEKKYKDNFEKWMKSEMGY